MDENEFEKRISALDPWAELVRTEMVRLITDRPAPIIYHYTDVTGLIGLITSGYVWATHAGKLNDTSENRHGYEFVINHVRANFPKETKSLIERSLSELHGVDTYVACYSTQRDLLSLWRNYTKQRVGYSLGFETRQMATIDSKMPVLEQVIYEDKTAQLVINCLLEKVDQYFYTHSFGEVEVGYVSGMVTAMLNVIACIKKHNAFSEEYEYRQIYQPGTTTLTLNTEFRKGKFGLTPYVKIEFLEKGRLPLKTITVGPCQDPEAECKILESFLSKTGYANVQVLTSEIPLRT
jgi:hypothetical protein